MNRFRLLQAAFLSCVVVFAGIADALRAEDWSPLWSTMSLPRTGGARLAAASLGGKVFFAGGDRETVPGAVDIYDTATNTWSTATLSQARTGPAAAAAGSKVLFGGGRAASGKSGVVDIYDAESNSWSTAVLSEARTVLAAASAGGKVYFGGGEAGAYSNTVDIYNTATGAWTTAQLSQRRQILTAAATDSEVFFAGGHTYGGTTAVVDIFDVATDTRRTATLSVPRYGLAGASAGGMVLFGGGESGPSGRSDVVDIYDSATDTWSSTNLSVSRYYLAAAALGEKVFFAGGYFESRQVDVYDLATQSWSVATLSAGRPELAAVAAGSKVFFAGGRDRSDVDVYTLQDYSTITSAKPWILEDRTRVAGLMQLNPGASLHLGDFDLAVGSMGGAAPINLGSRMLTVGGDNTDCSYSGPITGDGSLVKTGLGTLVLGGVHSYRGETRVAAGTLQVDGSLDAANAASVAEGAALTGHGTLGAVIVRLGGRLAPGGDGGASVGTLTLLGNLTLEFGSQLDFDLAALTASDSILLPGATLMLIGQEFGDFHFTPLAGFGPGDYTLIHAGAISGNLGTDRAGNVGGLPASLYVSGGDLILYVVPEPSSLAILGAAAMGLLACRWCGRHWAGHRRGRARP